MRCFLSTTLFVSSIDAASNKLAVARCSDSGWCDVRWRSLSKAQSELCVSVHMEGEVTQHEE